MTSEEFDKKSVDFTETAMTWNTKLKTSTNSLMEPSLEKTERKWQYLEHKGVYFPNMY